MKITSKFLTKIVLNLFLILSLSFTCAASTSAKTVSFGLVIKPRKEPPAPSMLSDSQKQKILNDLAEGSSPHKLEDTEDSTQKSDKVQNEQLTVKDPQLEQNQADIPAGRKSTQINEINSSSNKSDSQITEDSPTTQSRSPPLRM